MADRHGLAPKANALTFARGNRALHVICFARPASSTTTNSLSYYYEIHGTGEPLLLLHGGLGSIDMFGPVLPALAANRQVIAVDMQGHGRTALGDRAVDPVDIAGDLAVVLKQLGYNQVDVLGYSFGGMTGLRLAVQHPSLVRRLVIASAMPVMLVFGDSDMIRPAHIVEFYALLGGADRAAVHRRQERRNVLAGSIAETAPPVETTFKRSFHR